jgi:two-component system NtrC family sensor kinase
MRRVGDGDFSGPLELRGHDELSELAAGLNTMCEQLLDAKEKVRLETEARIRALEQLRHEDRLTTVGKLASGITHELGTPLNVISGRAWMIAKGNLSPREIIEGANTIKAQSERITAMVRQLLDFARLRSTTKTLADLRQITQQAVDLMSSLGYKQKVDICLVAEDTPITANVDAEQIQQVLMNIITNALQAMPEGGKVEVGIEHEHARPPEGYKGSEGEYFHIYVKDEGKGISKEDMPHIFEPFFTTKETGEGTGLGLSIALGIVREHGGWIDVQSEPGKGSCFSIYLPEGND